MNSVRISSDIGNSKTKMFVGEELIKQPSVISYEIKSPKIVEKDIKKNIATLDEFLTVNITSKAIRKNGLYYVGHRASRKGNAQNMNIKLGEKYKHDIPVVMNLAMIAGQLVKEHYEKNNELPNTLEVNSVMATAIPASEYNPQKAEVLAKRFTDSSHVVIVHVGEELCTVNITFKKVKVTQEGIPALYALLKSKEDILSNFSKTYKDEKLTLKELQNKKILHADIGDGTTEYIYTVGMNPDLDACTGLKRGVGHASEDAIQLMKEELNGALDINRQKFMDFVLNEEENLHELAKRCMDQATIQQSELILEDIQNTYINNTHSSAEYFLVYGGGSIEFKSELEEYLIEFANDTRTKVIWIPENYAVDMNVNGLKILNEKVLFKRID